MGLRELQIKQSYDSESDNVLRDFYIPALTESTKYQRIAGFFSSRILAVAARGILPFIKRNGTMELIVGATLTNEDIRAINAGLSKPEELIQSSMIRELSEINEDFIRDHVKALAWMVAKGLLKIKVVIPIAGKGLFEDRESLKGIFHQKVGVLVDENNDMMTFSGSINETATGWLSNIEEFKVFRSWIDSEKPYFDSDLKKMQKFLSGKATNALIVDVPTAVRDNLVRLAPASIDEIDLNKYYASEGHIIAKRKLRYYQKNAIDNWRDNDYHGIAEMATGSGKTLFALRAVDREVPDDALSIIAVPGDILTKQWKSGVQEEFTDPLILVCSSENPDWKDKLTVVVDYLKTGNIELRRIFVITTYHTGSTDKFRNVLARLPVDKLCIVADEVHHVGAPQFSRILNIDCRYRLGLSATPERPWDEEGEEKINAYFGKKIMTYPIDQALADDILSKYTYHVLFVALDPDELQEYRDTSRKISAKVSTILKRYPFLKGVPFPRLLAEISSRDSAAFYSIQNLMLQRTNKLKEARQKLEALKRIIHGSGLKRCLVYCNDMAHLGEVVELFYQEGISTLKYDSSMTEEEKERNMKSFSDGNAEFLVAVKCLDEGVDLPTCDSAILVSSSKSEREFIQRRGRLLRKHPSKKIANIFDILILPVDPSVSNTSITEVDYKIIENEIDRAKVFARSALNGDDVLLEISKMEQDLSSRIET